MAGLVVKPRSRIYHGHDWVYSTEILKSFGGPQDGEVISLKDGRDRLLGSAIYNSKSQIVARRFSRQRQHLDLDFFQRRIRQALTVRERRGINPRLARLVWSESDGVPGLILDRYNDCVVLQTLTLAMDLAKPVIVEAIRSVLSPSTIIERNDAPVRRAEGMELQSGILFGEDPGLQLITVDGLEYQVDLLRGHKTGFYLDQVDNYKAVASQAKGLRVLDCFSNQGAFALSCARAGAASVRAVEISADACGQIRENAKRNNLQVDVQEANVFDFLNDQEKAGERYDLIILDPPTAFRR